MAHRIREAMRDLKPEPMGGDGKTVEIDETYTGFQEGANIKTKRQAAQFRNVVVTLVERGGSARSFHVDEATIAKIIPIVRMNVRRESIVMTDEASIYRQLGTEYLSHDAVNHAAKEYVRYSGEDVITTNTVEGYYSIFKRGMKGVYQHCAEKHLHRYLAEFDFRYNTRVKLGYTDAARAEKAMQGIVGKRLMYRRPSKAEVN